MKPTTATAKRVAALFGRSENSSWSSNEIILFRALIKSGYLADETEFKMIENYYRIERAKCNPFGVHRRDLYTFLIHYEGELDRARAFEAKRKPKIFKLKPNGEKPVGDEERDRIAGVVKREVEQFRNNLRGGGERTTEGSVTRRIPNL